MKKLFLFLIVSVWLFLLVSCTPSAVTSEERRTTVPCVTVEVPVTTEVSVTTVKETAFLTPEEIAANPYAAAGLELTLTVCRQYYDLTADVLATNLEDRNIATVWPLTAYIEMLAEAHRLYPDHPSVKKYYRKALEYCLSDYLVEDVTIRSASGEFYHHMLYYNAGANRAGDYYYDDNAWIAIRLIDAYRQLDEKKYLELAEGILSFLWTGWDTQKGGIFWDRHLAKKGICTNGSACVAYLMAYEVTQNEIYLERAKEIYAWCNRMLKSRGGLYHADLLDVTASSFSEENLHPFIASYDQGTMMTASSLFYRITNDRTYYEELKMTAQSTIGLMFRNEDAMKGNPIFKSWGVGWAVRGEMNAYAAGCTGSSARFMQYFDSILNQLLTTKDENGHYDPYFMTGEWWPPEDQPDVDRYDSDVMQPAGVATAFLLTAQYQLYQNKG